MKKILTLLVAVLVAATTVSAKSYKHSLGLVAGLGIGAQYKCMVLPNFTIIDEFGYFTCTSNGAYGGAIDNLVLAYQGKGKSGRGIDLEWYAGGQIKAGYAAAMGDMGIVGVGGAVGLEAIMQNAPIAFSFDFRPGYACLFAGGAVHMFDYSFNLGVRYLF